MTDVFSQEGLGRRGDQSVGSSVGEGRGTGVAQGVSSGDAWLGNSPEEHNMDNFFSSHLLAAERE